MELDDSRLKSKEKDSIFILDFLGKNEMSSDQLGQSMYYSQVNYKIALDLGLS